MRPSITTIVALSCIAVAACGNDGGGPASEPETVPNAAEPATTREASSVPQSIEVAPGLTAVILKPGYGRAAEPGDYVDVHYTGWLYDETAGNSRGAKFDSSIDRGQRFQFQLGAGQVIQGWDQGIVGMLIGETRQLTIAPEMGYGSRGAGNVIPPGATLVFEVELFALEAPGGEPTD